MFVPNRYDTNKINKQLSDGQWSMCLHTSMKCTSSTVARGNVIKINSVKYILFLVYFIFIYVSFILAG